MIDKFNLKIDTHLYEFINNEVLQGLDLDKEIFWSNFSNIVDEFNPINKKLLKKRKDIQIKINEWNKNYKGKDVNIEDYKKFLVEIEYLIKEGDKFKVETTNIDPEIAYICGPQLVVPITNARYALNAVNARWGSFYDAIYGTNVLGSLPNLKKYDMDKLIQN